MNSWLLFAIGGPLFWAFGNVFDSVIRRNYVKNNMVMTWYLAFTRIPYLILFFILIDKNFPPLSLTLAMLVTGFVWIAAFFFYYRAIEQEEVSRVALLMQLVPIFTFLFAFVFIQETLTSLQWLGFGFLFLGGLISAVKNHEGKWHFSLAFWVMLLASILWAISDVFFKKLSTSFINFSQAFFIFFLGGFLFALIQPWFFGWKRLFSHFRGLPQRAWIILIIHPIIAILGTICFNYALTLGKASLTAVVVGTQPLFAFLFTLIFGLFIREVTKENLSKQNLTLKFLSLFFILSGLLFLA